MFQSRIIFAVLSICSCASEDEPRWQGRYVSIYTDDTTQELCFGSFTHLDQYLERIFAFLEEPIPDTFHVPVYLVDEASCFSADHSACYDGQAVYMRSLASNDSRALGVMRH